MVKRNRLRNGRPQAQFGIDGGIMAAATIASAAIQAAAMNKNAKEQAKAIQIQTDNNTRLTEQQMEATKQEYDKNRALQRNMQMTLQMMAGKQNTNELKDAAKTQVKCGGSSRRKLRKVGGLSNTYFLRGSDGNLPFTVTDGGSVIPMGYTPEGYALYQVIGKDHEHRNEDGKTGVGIKFPTMPSVAKRSSGGKGANVIEAEGNQNSNLGELMLVTPTDAKFISKHSIKGFNPAKAVLAGVHPLKAFAAQENIKDIYGISDDGKGNYSSPVRSIRFNGGVTSPQLIPDMSLDYFLPAATGIASELNKDNQARYGRSLKRCCGRRKAYNGADWWNDYGGSFMNSMGNLASASAVATGNIVSSGILNLAQSRAYKILRDAYNNVRTIDLNSINRKDYEAPHVMAALQSPIINTSAEMAAADRVLQRQLTDNRRNSLSSAAMLDRNAKAAVGYNDLVGNISSEARKARQSVLAENMRTLNQVANENANMDVQANQLYLQSKLNLMQYNNDILNEATLGKGQAAADMHLAKANNLAGALTSSVNAFGTAFQNSAKGYSDEHSERNRRLFELDIAKVPASPASLYRWYQLHPNDPGIDAFMKYLHENASNDNNFAAWEYILKNNKR